MELFKEFFILLLVFASANSQGCSSFEFTCDNGNCIPASWECDTDNDCGDSSDEDHCCSSTQFTCDNNNCIPSSWECDTDNDCGDNSDEDHCSSCSSTQFTCDNGNCITASWECDTDNDCGDNSDEDHCSSCSSFQFTCDNGNCITASWECDTDNDCGDNSDEDHCCSSTQFTCDNGNCITASWECDTDNDCGDNSDEDHCSTSCSSTQFTCDNGNCIPASWECDTDNDCGDNSDEDHCSTSCSSTQFTCDNGNCITASWECDTDNDCGDNSDEDHCSTSCSSTQFTCDNGNCITASWECDTDNDCGDNSDEDHCCTSDQYTCSDGTCIPASWECDVFVDCSDGGDEASCETTTPACTSDQYTCSDGTCIPASWECDVIVDCSDGGDEASCDSCTSVQFTCDNGNCIPASWECDTDNDCGDNSDEDHCTTTPACTSDQYTCSDGTCIPASWECDVIVDCSDGGDEASCDTTTPACTSDQYTCSDGTCILASWECDVFVDCSDGGDEASCTCTSAQYACSDGVPACIPDVWECDGIVDCSDGSDEASCGCDGFSCDDGSCLSSSLQQCDGTTDCSDGSDETTCAELTVNITTTPSGPDYPAATSIQFLCSAVGGSGSYNFQWNIYCNATGALVYQAPLGNFDLLTVGSVPTGCSDHVECIVVDVVLPALGSAYLTVESIVGVGLLATSNPIQNNTALLADSSNDIGTLFCVSGGLSSNTAKWLAPDGTDMMDNNGSFAIVRGEGSTQSYIALQLNTGYSLTDADEGVYTCIIPDENGIEQTLYVGLYRFGFYAIPSVTISSSSYPLFTLNCTSTGAPATALLVNNLVTNSIYGNDDTHFIEYKLRDGVNATYDTTLAFATPPLSDIGLHACIAITTYDSANTSNTDTSSATGFTYYLLSNLGESRTITCGGASAPIQWVDNSGTVVAYSDGSSVTLAIVITDTHHANVYRCVRSGLEDLRLTIITIVPSPPIVVQVSPSSTGAPTAGSSYSLTCIVLDDVSGLSSIPEIEWINPEGDEVVNGGGITVGDAVYNTTTATRTISFTSIRTSHVGQYTCQATLSSPALTIPFIGSDATVVNVTVPAPMVAMELLDDPIYHGGNVSLGCAITLHAAVDSGVSVSVMWTGPNGGLVDSSSVAVMGATMISSQLYYSNVTISDANPSLDSGVYTCGVTVTGLSYVIGSTGSVSRNITVIDPALDVEVQPSYLTILNVAPYNNLTLTCTATVSDSVTAVKLFEWRRGGATLTHDGYNVIVLNQDLTSALSTSILTTSETTGGTVNYTCTATAVGSTGVDYSSVMVTGPIPPASPTRLRLASVTYTTVNLEWTIPYIAYTPETYIVKYGTSETALDLTSDSVSGSTDLTTSNQVFSAELTGLIHDTSYYYKVQAMNSYTISDSETVIFVTHPLPLIVLIHATGNTTAGSEFTLTCTAVEDENITGIPEIIWTGPNGPVSTSDIGITLDDPVTVGATTTSLLLFSPLSVYHDGEYTCVAYVDSIQQQQSDSYNVTVQKVPLQVSISSSLVGSSYQAASSVSLTCNIIGNVHTPATYQWSSTCTGDCFILGSNESTVSQRVLRSVDSGTHTCTVVDAVGNTGSASMQMNVVGIGISAEGIGLLPNNSFITADISGMIGQLQCSSGSTMARVGSWIAPSGDNITYSNIDPFDVTVGSTNNPGYLSIQQASGHSLTVSFQGIYTCILPDENGVERSFLVGIYPNEFNIPISITSLGISQDINSVFVLDCTSTGSPATTVTWARDGVPVTSDGTYTLTQVLDDGSTATYKNQLQLLTGPYGIPGLYSCNASNVLGSDSEQITITGLQTSTSMVPFIVGQMASITCTSDLDVTSIEWLYDGGVVLSSTGQQELELTFNPVNDSLYGEQYTCRITSPYGIQETTVPIIAEISPDDLTTSISINGDPTPGEQFSLNCTVTYPEGLTNPVMVEWRDAYGPVTADDDITVGELVASGTTTITQALVFNPLRIIHTGSFVCRATLTSPAPPFNLTETAEVDIIVEAIAELQLTISSTPDPGDTTFPAGSSVALTCHVDGGHPPLSYQWSSTCDQQCFVTGQTTQSIAQSVLHSSDSGNHTCDVKDYVGHTGSTYIEMIVSGVGLHLMGTGLLQNNSILLASNTGRIGELQCISGTTSANVGSWITPNGTTHRSGNPFEVTAGDESDPGYLSIQLVPGYSLTHLDEGVYTCVIPDERGDTQYLYIGIYPSGFSSVPRIDSLQQIADSSGALTLLCTSTSSPVITVVWTKDTIPLATNDIYTMSQSLVDGNSATYDNLLMANVGPAELSGTYGCIVHDSQGHNSEQATLDVQALNISGYSGTLMVGESANIICSSDLDGTRIQWLYNGTVVANSSSSQANLIFNPVSDSLHNRQYTCRVSNMYGSVEQTITISVQVPETALTLSLSTPVPPVAGYIYNITCTVTVVDGLSDAPNVVWVNSEGEEIQSDDDIIVYGPDTSGLVTDLTLEFEPLRTYDEGQYTCVATISSPALSTPLNTSDSHYIDVELTYPLGVTITDLQDPTIGPEYTPGSSVIFNCTVSGAIGSSSFLWTSTCTGNCFILSQQTQHRIERDILHSVDSGNHTCTVTDDVGNSGSATLEMSVVGASFYSFDVDSPGTFPDNSIIVADNFGQIPQMQCISGSNTPNVGQWVAPNGQDLTNMASDKFDVTVGGSDDPGYVEIAVSSSQVLTLTDQGVYTCSIPDETGVNIPLHVGIYLEAYIGTVAVTITSLEETTMFGSSFTLNCATTGSPPTNVTWSKDGNLITSNEMYQFTKMLTDASTGTYSNLLVVNREPDDVTGTYVCSIENSISPVVQETTAFEGVQISGDFALIVGESATISCITDLNVEILEWVHGDSVLANSTSQQLDLTFDLVTDLHHGKAYICRATTTYGSQERNITLTVQIPSGALMVSLDTAGNATAGHRYELLCTASKNEGLQNTPSIKWFDPEGQRVVHREGDIEIGAPRVEEDGSVTLPLEFIVLHTSDAGQYTCVADLYSLALESQLPLTVNTTIDITVEAVNLIVEVVGTPMGPVVNAADSLTLLCRAAGGTNTYSYQWSSNCTGNCFVDGQTGHELIRDALRSTDSGNHTCVVTDDAGNTGSESIMIGVQGVGLYLSGSEQIANNSIIMANGNGRINQLLCLSGSMTARVGQWIGLNGTNITTTDNDPFDVRVGGSYSPGSVEVQTPDTSSPLSSANEGVYTCVIPDESGETNYLYVGIYLSGFSTNPSISSLEQVPSSVFTLSCVSTSSPATTVAWTKDNAPLANSDIYNMYQVLTDGATSTFKNNLVVYSSPASLLGSYGCTVVNSIGSSTTETITIQGLRISGNEGSLTVGDTATLTCSSDLDVTMIEWLRDGEVVVSSTATVAELVLNQVNDSIHEVEYTCRVTSPYGSEERSTTVVVSVPQTALRVYTTIMETATAGQSYSLSCTASKLEAVLATPALEWLDQDGYVINSGGGVTVSTPVTSGNMTTLTLEFGVILTSHAGQYTCQASLESPALSSPLTKMAGSTLAVQISQPSVEVSRQTTGSLYAGSSQTLTCVISLSTSVDTDVTVSSTWRRSGELLGANDRISISNTTQTDTIVYQSELQLSPISLTLDSGVYTCQVVVTADPSTPLVLDATTSGMETITVQSPVLSVAVAPSSVSVLDIAPYNTFTLGCSATQPSSVTITKTIEWIQTIAGAMPETVVPDETNINITTSDLDSPTSTSVLSMRVNTAGEGLISCVTSLQVPGDSLVTQAGAAQINIRGPVAPEQPIQLTHTTISSNSATVQWIVPIVAYTQETYAVNYGTSQSSLNLSSTEVTGSSDITATNQVYQLTLNGLEEDTTYFYQVVATNDVGSNSSEIATFTTSSSVLMVVVGTEGNMMAGEPLTLTCTVSVLEGVSGVPVIAWRRPDGSSVDSDDLVTVGDSETSDQITTRALEFHSLYTSHGGQYTCIATLDVDGSTSTALVTKDVIVQIPPSTVSISRLPEGVVYTGTTLTLNCTAELSQSIDTGVTISGVWRRSGELLTSDGRTLVLDSVGIGFYSSSVEFSPLSGTIDSGDYTCTISVTPDPSTPFILMSTASDDLTLNVEALPIPTFSITTEGTSTVGGAYTLICTAFTINGLVESATTNLSWIDASGDPIATNGVRISETEYTVSLEFNPLVTSHGGQYSCHASTTIPEISLTRSSSDSVDVRPQVPEPTVAIELSDAQASFLAGTPLELSCSIQLDSAIDSVVSISTVWQRDGLNITGSARITITPPTVTISLQYVSLLQFSTLSSSTDSGSYTCVTTVGPTSSESYIVGATGMDVYTTTVDDPTVTAVVIPSSFNGLDIEPYNSFTFTCNGTKPAVVLPTLELSWYHNEDLLDGSVEGINIVEAVSDDGAQASSQLYVTGAGTSGSGSYYCYVRVSIPESNVVEQSQEATVAIRGPSPPSTPTLPSAMNITASAATISWLITSITYNPENYTVTYGLTSNNLDFTSDIVQGTADISSTNTRYSVTVTRLAPYTQYYYQVVAENLAGNTESAVGSFLTAEAVPTIPPEELQTSVTFARNVTLTWAPPPEQGRNGIITFYRITCIETINGGLVVNTTTTETTLTVKNLKPAFEYRCHVTASTSVGEGPAAQLLFTTAEDVPEDAPTDVIITGISVSSVSITWTPPSIPNGVITHYTIYVDYADGSSIAALYTDNATTIYVLAGLEPYQLVIVYVSASTAIGEGPKSEAAEGRSSEIPVTAPEVSIIPDGTPTAGEQYTLLCTVTVGEEPHTGPEVVWLGPDGEILTSEGEIIVATEPVLADSPTRLTTHALIFTTLRTSRGGTYYCQATILSPYGTIGKNTSTSLDVIVQVPTPSVSIGALSEPVYAGINQIMTCAIKLSAAVNTAVTISATWRKEEEALTNTTQLTISDAVPSGESIYQTQLSFHPLQWNTSDGEYSCSADVTPSPLSQFILASVIGTDSIKVEATAPTLDVDIQPSSAIVLDTAPYNTIILTCIATASEGVIIAKSFAWKEGPLDSQTIIMDNGDTVLISIDNVESPESTSTLTVMEKSVGQYMYTCSVKMNIPEGLEITSSFTANVTVQGPKDPVQPIDLRAIDITAERITITWVIPYIAYTPEEYQVHYGNSQELLDETSGQVESIIDAIGQAYSVIIAELEPGTQYYFQVASRNSYGSTQSDVISAATLDAAPSGPPLEFTIMPEDPRSLTFSWEPPAVGERNGVITEYTLSCQPDTEDLPMSFASSGSYTLQGFTPATTYTCTVYASTNSGNGPSAFKVVTTLDDVPGPVTMFNVTVISPSEVQVLWNQPEITNGEIVLYSVEIYISTRINVTRNVAAGQPLEVFVGDRDEGVPYTVSVKAKTSAGFGRATIETIFTKEEIPSVPPKNIGPSRVNATHMNITWGKLSLEEARGFITHYTITYDVKEDRRKREATVVEVQPEGSYKVIGGLDLKRSYGVELSASTIEGEGVKSSTITVNAPPSSLFQLRLTGVPSCNEWRFQDTNEKIDDIRNEIVTRVEQCCECSITSEYISKTILSCPEEQPEDVIFRARIYSTAKANNIDLIDCLELWVATGPTINIQNNGIPLDPACTVEIQSFDDAVCPPVVIEQILFFQLRLAGVPEGCADWKLQGTDEGKKSDITDAVVTSVATCTTFAGTFTAQHINDTRLSCPEEREDVIFRARISTTPQDSNALINCIKIWVEKGPTVNIMRIGIPLDPSCTVEIQSFDDDVCPQRDGGGGTDEQSESDSGGDSQLIVIVVVASVGGIGIVLAFILAIYIFTRMRRRAKYRVRHNLEVTSQRQYSESSDTYVPMGPATFVLSNQHASPTPFDIPEEYYSKAAEACLPPTLPPPRKSLANQNPYEAVPPGGFLARPQFTCNSETDDYIKMETSLGPDEALYERIPGEGSGTQ